MVVYGKVTVVRGPLYLGIASHTLAPSHGV